MSAVPYLEQHSHNNGLTVATEWIAIRDMKKKNQLPSWLSIWTDSTIVVIGHQWLLFLPKRLSDREQQQRPCLCRWNDINQIHQYRWYPSLPIVPNFHQYGSLLITGQDGSAYLYLSYF
jgi:hypothetical protein